jgi:hypothetical protein
LPKLVRLKNVQQRFNSAELFLDVMWHQPQIDFSLEMYQPHLQSQKSLQVHRQKFQEELPQRTKFPDIKQGACHLNAAPKFFLPG